MQDLAVIIVRDPVMPLLPLHALKDIGGLDLQYPMPAILIDQLPIQGSMHPWVIRIKEHVVLFIQNLILWEIQSEQSADMLLRLCSIFHIGFIGNILRDYQARLLLP